jgi:uncharacterized membrane protein YphA (DoxX/SURF4 family)
MAWLCALGLAAVFLAAALLKLRDVAGFYREIENYQVFPPVLAVGLAYYVPALELVAAVAVLVPRWRRPGALVLGLLLAAFLGLLTSAWVRGLDISCGCFGVENFSANYPWLLARDTLLLALAAWVYYIGGLHKSTSTP